MEKFEGVDYYQTEELLSLDERMVRDTVRQFVEERVVPIIDKYFRDAAFPQELVPELAKLGLFGANLHGYGCAGMNNVAYGLALQELERGDASVRALVAVQGGLVMYPIMEFGSEEQKDRWLTPLARGEALGCFGLTEPDSGSDPTAMLTTATEKGDCYVLNGTKMWITNGALADVAVIWAKTPEGIRAFLVEKDTEGFRANEIKGKFSMRASSTAELVLEEVSVPKDNMLPKALGLGSALKCATESRYAIAWGSLGSAMACYETALKFALNRVAFGKPVAAFQLTQDKLVDMVTEITKAQLLCLRLGQLRDQGKARYPQVSLAKRNNVAKALQIARMARSILAASGIVDEYPVIRHMCNLESIYTYEGTHEIQTLVVGRDLTGHAAFV